MKRTGSALILTLLIISVISSVSFAVTVLSLSEFRKASNLQDSIAAFYSAESGLEQGLLQYRLWHDAEISQKAYTKYHSGASLLDADSIPTSATTTGDHQPFTLGSADTPAGFVNSATTPKDSWYDLKMYYRGDSIGKLDSSGTPIVDTNLSPRISRDSAAQFNVKGADSLQIAWKPDQVTEDYFKSANPTYIDISGRPGKYFVELILSDSTGLCDIEHKIHPIYMSGPDDEETPQPDIFHGCKYDTVRVKPWNMNQMQYSLKLMNGGKTLTMDSLVTKIISTGYSGKSKRTLEIDVSRTSGTILESGDFLFLSGSGDLKF